MFAKIKGTGSYLPDNVLTNEMLTTMVETSDEWIKSRTGVEQRHIAKTETVAFMAGIAAKRALADASKSGIKAEDLELLIVCTCSAEQMVPCVACEVQTYIGAINAVCFDINVACTGFITAYQQVAAQMKAGMIKTAMIIGVESLSNMMDFKDRGTCILFGDGAGAVIFSCNQGENLKIPVILHADGSKGHVLTACSGLGMEKAPYPQKIAMDGKEVFQFAVRNVPAVIKELSALCDASLEDIDLFILHQANKRIVEGVSKKLKQDIKKFPMDMMYNGNMSSASIPVLLDELNKAHKLRPGMKLIFAGFGAGLTWGGMYLEW
ncbi:MAG: ketoacyl-ACP synthase III [Lachnospiraceae bacterium]|nr:ketoacyl-ACP synthase III [Lachnospiraceae bacterium]